MPSKNELPSWGTDLTILLIQERDRILTVMLRLTSLFGILGIFSVMGNLFKRERWDLVLTYLAGMFIVGIISYLRQINYVIRALTFLAIVFFMGVIDLSFFGVAEDWRLYFSGFTILTTVFLGWRMGVGALLLSLAAFVTIAWQISVGRIVITASAMVSPVPNLENIITFSLVFVMTNGVLITAVSALLNEFERVSKKEREAASQLRQKTADLEQSLYREQQLANDVAVALHQEEALSQLRAKIITTISHEFRTPLAVINNSVNLLNKYEGRLSDEKRHQQFERISESIQYLTNLLKDVSLVNNQQAETTNLQLETISFGMLHNRLKTELLEEVDYPGNLQFTAVGPPDYELILDVTLLKQVLLNLLSNAIKYSVAQTPIQLNITLTSNLTISLIDHGIGILAEEKVNIWELFYRGNNIEAQRGLGLGLFIVKQFLVKMNGSITLTDNPTGGSIFTIKLPRQPQNQSAF
ncbi:MAG: hypothetical protein DHS20C20_18210 [Ardenticatenaceae bacterium]|nr:MAG: hypothetical protein DHS20C20_18210 [Ardenticatenaceae bacterium]